MRRKRCWKETCQPPFEYIGLDFSLHGVYHKVTQTASKKYGTISMWKYAKPIIPVALIFFQNVTKTLNMSPFQIFNDIDVDML